MTLTEEQRGALARAIDYINETDLPVGELDGFDREVLRSMVTTAINYGPDVMKMIELLAAGEHDQWADWAQSILDSEPGLSDGRKAAWPEMIATPYENLSEELKDKDRREVHLRSQAALDYIQQQSAEIERLRAFEMAARDLNNDLTRIAKERDEMATQIKKLKEDLEQAEICIRARLDVIDQLRVENKELQDAHKRSGKKYAKIINELRSSVYANIPGLKKQWDEVLTDGKISIGDHIVGPDQMVPCWQITEERMRAIRMGEELAWDCKAVAVLRAMLQEAGL
ncbi:MAG: hypothetical protein WC261_11305 [Synergistaceae bacterium]|jgi:hypothetical protein